MAACSIFDEDEVCISTSGGFKYGLVVESSEYVSSDEEDEEDGEDRVQKGKIKVAWHPMGNETVVLEEKVTLTDRSLMPGDVVRRLISGKESQRGFVQECHIKCHVKVLGTENYIYNINAKELKPLQEFDPEPEVIMDSWVGHVEEVMEEVTVRFPCGARCKFRDNDLARLEDVNEKGQEYSEFSVRNYYEGQELTGTHEDYEDVDWLNTSNVRGPKCKHKQMMRANVVVENVKTHNVHVIWTCKGFTQNGARTDQLQCPPEVVEGDDLKRLRRLDCFEYCHMQLGDKAYHTVKDSDTILYQMSPRKHITPDVIVLAAKEKLAPAPAKSDSDTRLGKRNAPEKLGGSADKTSESGEKLANGSSSKNESVESGDDDYEDVEDDVSDKEGTESDAASSTHSGVDGQAGSTHPGNDGQLGPAPKKKKSQPLRPQRGGNKKNCTKRGKNKKAKRAEREVKPGVTVPVEIWYTFSCCDVMWQDGSIEKDIPSPELFPIHHLDEHEFFPGDFVQNVKVDSVISEYGVIVSSDYKERTVMVKWIKPYIPFQSNRPQECDGCEEMSVFDIKDHPDYKFRCGSTVLRVGGFEEDKVYEAVGQVCTLDPEGTVQVWWPDKTITKCFPQDLFLPGDEFDSEEESECSDSDDDLMEEEEEEMSSDVSWETDSSSSERDQDGGDGNRRSRTSWTVNDSKKTELDSLLDRAQTALRSLQNVFQNVSGPLFKNPQDRFNNILAIFKRCKELEKVLKSSFFDDDEIADLIIQIKDEIRRDKSAKWARHIADVYKYRTGVVSECPSGRRSLASSSRDSRDSQSSLASGTNNVSPVSGTNVDACSTNSTASSVTPEINDANIDKYMKDMLVDIRMNLDDPLLEIIFDSSLEMLNASSRNQSQEDVQNVNDPKTVQSLASGEKKTKTDGEQAGTASASAVLETDVDNLSSTRLPTSRRASNSEVMDMLVRSLRECQNNTLQAKFTAIREKLKLHYEGVGQQPGSADSSCDKGPSTVGENGEATPSSDEGYATAKTEPESSVSNQLETRAMQLESGALDTSESQAETKPEATASKTVVEHSSSKTVVAEPSSSKTAVAESSSSKSAVTETSSSKTAAMEPSSSKTSESNTKPENLGSNASNAEPPKESVSNASKTSAISVPPTEKEMEISSNHRALCIKVVEALMERIVLIKQDVNRKWLAFKLGCDENMSDSELFEKMQEKIIESVESGNRPLQLNMDPAIAQALLAQQRGATMASTGECVQEIEALEGLRKSPEGSGVAGIVKEVRATESMTFDPEDSLTFLARMGKETDVDAIVMNHVASAIESVVSAAIMETDSAENSSLPPSESSSAEQPIVTGAFEVCSESPHSHRFKYEGGMAVQQPKAFLNAVRKQWKLLRTSLPEGIIVKAFEDRMDLVSVLIKGPAATPYEDGLFAFDVFLPVDFPNMPPVFHYWSFCSERLNPNLYEDGKVCVSLLGTWSGKGSELWSVGSSLLQVLVSIQGLILVKEPYFNEAGYEKQRGSQHGQENSRMYNEMALLKLLQSMTKMAVSPPAMFVEETRSHLKTNAQKLIDRIENWIEISKKSRSEPQNKGETSQAPVLSKPKPDATGENVELNPVVCNGDVAPSDIPKDDMPSDVRLAEISANSSEQIPSVAVSQTDSNERLPSAVTAKSVSSQILPSAICSQLDGSEKIPCTDSTQAVMGSSTKILPDVADSGSNEYGISANPSRADSGKMNEAAIFADAPTDAISYSGDQIHLDSGPAIPKITIESASSEHVISATPSKSDSGKMMESEHDIFADAPAKATSYSGEQIQVNSSPAIPKMVESGSNDHVISAVKSESDSKEAGSKETAIFAYAPSNATTSDGGEQIQLDKSPPKASGSSEQIPSTKLCASSEQIPCQEATKTETNEPIASAAPSPAKETGDPGFPLLPASKGFCIAVAKHLATFKEVLAIHIFTPDDNVENLF